MLKKLLAFTCLTLSIGANAATINVRYTEVSVGLNYLIGFGPVTSTDSASATSDGLQPAVALLGEYIEGYWPTIPAVREFNSIGVDSTASASIAYDTTASDPSFYGTSSASISFDRILNRGTGIAFAPSNENSVFYEFEVLDDGPVDYSLGFESDVGGFLRLKNSAGQTVLNLSPGLNFGSLAPGIYTLDTFLGLQGTSLEGAKSGSTSFAMTFMDSTLNVNPVPLPAAAWLFMSTLGGLVVAKRRQLKA